ncbi:uncharacterized protein EV422DRAFT_565178 [Fimicolochytrium jonesii]|uniref:uncharacterized protein n=1 Tax=Fimicolochytrium jonesii TaxID=1396493 RepID=UPI0022FE898D|nr:uncharacterized protein EV422DRAFT_565178 [Fimicolochytrium jonesii]KAI8824489.1 hypothetical protein EV422DRAFT_565178 [Fimicolochytrium jonesii]
MECDEKLDPALNERKAGERISKTAQRADNLQIHSQKVMSQASPYLSASRHRATAGASTAGLSTAEASKANAEDLKAAGNRAMSTMQYVHAIKLYSEAFELDAE